MHICHMTTVHPVQDARIFYRMSRALAARGCTCNPYCPGILQ